MSAASDSDGNALQLFEARPELFAKYQAFYSEIWNQDIVPTHVLARCQARIAAIHGCEADIELKPLPDDALSRKELVALALAEKIPFHHHGVEDDEVAAVRDEFGASGTVTLLVALSFFDVTCRWQLALGAL